MINREFADFLFIARFSFLSITQIIYDCVDFDNPDSRMKNCEACAWPPARAGGRSRICAPQAQPKRA
ncbi:hypothetical protein, partial [Burkholderia cenocepacia]|uniref:hypothetical protein n=1 Tax=Burkholderia cenocepacia TaxID=95486 RepID=UPI00195577A2